MNHQPPRVAIVLAFVVILAGSKNASSAPERSIAGEATRPNNGVSHGNGVIHGSDSSRGNGKPMVIHGDGSYGSAPDQEAKASSRQASHDARFRRFLVEHGDTAYGNDTKLGTKAVHDIASLEHFASTRGYPTRDPQVSLQIFGPLLKRFMNKIDADKRVLVIGDGTGKRSNGGKGNGYDLDGKGPNLLAAAIFDPPQAFLEAGIRVGGKPTITGIGLEPPSEAHSQLHKMMLNPDGTSSKYNYMPGRKIESLRRSEFSKSKGEKPQLFHEIISQYAELTYTGDLARTITADVRMLEIGGELLSHLSPRTEIVDRNGNNVTELWLRSAKGITVLGCHVIQAPSDKLTVKRFKVAGDEKPDPRKVQEQVEVLPGEQPRFQTFERIAPAEKPIPRTFFSFLIQRKAGEKVYFPPLKRLRYVGDAEPPFSKFLWEDAPVSTPAL